MQAPMTKAAIAAALIATGLSAASAETRTFNLPVFDRISVSNGLDVEIVVGEAQTISAEAENRKTLDKLDLKVKNGELKMKIDRRFLDFSGGLGKLFSAGPGITVYVTAPVVTALDAHSGSEVLARGMVADSLSFDVASGSQIEARDVQAHFIAVDGSSGAAAEIFGVCERLEADVSSGAFLRLGALACSTVHVEASSGARATVRASVSIEAEASSGGRVAVKGNPPQINIDTSSGGDVDFRFD